MVAATLVCVGQRLVCRLNEFVSRVRGVREARDTHRHAEAEVMSILHHDLCRALPAQTFHARMRRGQTDPREQHPETTVAESA